MSEQIKEEKTWLERNKKKVIFAGAIVAATVAGVLLYKNKDSIASLLKSLESHDLRINNQSPAMPPIKPENNAFKVETLEPIHIVVSQPINGGNPYEVIGHIRNLPEGYHPSPKKIAEAAELGITLTENQTWVTDYVKNVAA